jgi:hypothetical protein
MVDLGPPKQECVKVFQNARFSGRHGDLPLRKPVVATFCGCLYLLNSFLTANITLLSGENYFPTAGKYLPTTGKDIPTAEKYLPTTGKYLPTTEPIPYSNHESSPASFETASHCIICLARIPLR